MTLFRQIAAAGFLGRRIESRQGLPGQNLLADPGIKRLFPGARGCDLGQMAARHNHCAVIIGHDEIPGIDRRTLWQALARGDIALWSSDHSPSMRAAKDGRDVFTATSGVPGLETRLPLLFSEGLLAGRISLPRYLDLAGAAAARRFGLGASKGRIAPGYDADLVLWDPGHRWKIDPGRQQSRTDYCPYAGMQLTGKPVTALLRGQTVLQGGDIAPPTGRYLPRASAKPTHSVLKDPVA